MSVIVFVFFPGGSVTIDTGSYQNPPKTADGTGEKDYYLERLRVLRSKCGLDNAAVSTNLSELHNPSPREGIQ